MGIPAPEPFDVQDIQETRIALAFSGGVALAVYESGVALEFFRLVNREGVYAELPRHIGRVVVDVITGTSAGGLNGAFLANALVNGGDFNKVLNLWLHDASIDRLMYSPWRSDPESLLNGEWFHQRILDALTGEPRPGFHGEALQPSLDLFITATNVPGETVEVATRDKAKIATRTHRQVFTFRYRAAEKGSDETPINDFKTSDQMKHLAQACRATASFPFAFAPVLIEKGEMSERALHLTEDAYHIDGGVLENRPIGLALAAIAAKRADKQVQRKLFFVEPDPEPIRATVAGTKPRHYSAPEVVVKALVDLPTYQSLTTTLQDIEKHNESVDERKRTLTYFNDASVLYRSQSNGARGDDPFKAIADDGERAGEEAHGVPKFVPPTDRSSAFYRAMEDGYMDLRLKSDLRYENENPDSDDMYKALKGLADELRSQLDLEAIDGRKATEKRGEVRPDKDWPLHTLLYTLKTDILDHFDLKFSRRQYRYLVQVVRDLYPPPQTGSGGGSTDTHRLRRRATETLNRLKNYFYELDARVRKLDKDQADSQMSEIGQLIGQVQKACALVRAENGSIHDKLPHEDGPQRLKRERELREKHMPVFIGVIEGLLDQVRKSKLRRFRSDFLENLYEECRRFLKNEVLDQMRAFPNRPATPARDGERRRDFASAPADAYWTLIDALDSFFLRDMMVYPLMQGEEIAAELEPIHFVRISPCDAEGDGSQGKLAGGSLAHFGGFLNEAWRGNDIVRGRLDAVEIILRTFLPGREHELTRHQLLTRATEDIRKSMELRKMTILRPDKQTLARIPAVDKVRWGMGGALTTLKILRKSFVDSGAAGWLRWVLSPLNATISGLSIVTILSAGLLKWYSKQKRWAQIALIALAALIVGLFLWKTSNYWLGPFLDACQWILTRYPVDRSEG